MLNKSLSLLVCAAALLWAAGAVRADAVRKPDSLDLSAAVIVAPPNLAGTQQKAVTVLREELQKRTGIQLEQATAWPDARPVIALGLLSQSKQFAGPFAAELEKLRVPGPEGFVLVARQQPRPAVLIVAADSRGLLYGVGRLLREHDVGAAGGGGAGRFARRVGPQISASRPSTTGYGPKVNAYDAWSEAQFDQYIRELALFGANSIEILPPRTDDQRTSPAHETPAPGDDGPPLAKSSIPTA